MHCVDVRLRETISNDLLNRNYSFSFGQLKTDYYKLIFYVEYFLPPNEKVTPYHVEFELRLTHFGDPCDDRTYCQNHGFL
jgi:hypothetical protein